MKMFQSFQIEAWQLMNGSKVDSDTPILTVGGTAARIVPGSPKNKEVSPGAFVQSIPGPHVMCMISGDKDIVTFCLKTLRQLSEENSNGRPVILTASNQDTAIEIARTLFESKELINWKDHSEPWVYENAPTQRAQRKCPPTKVLDGKKMILTVPTKSGFYEHENTLVEDMTLIKFFDIPHIASVRSITTSGNSYNVDACRYIGEKLKGATDIRSINFSDMFTTRLKTQLPQSLKFMIDAVADKKIVELNLRDNAFGPAGVKSLESFLATCTTLKRLNVTNCGLGPEGATMIAQSMLKCEGQRLEEFYASRGRLEDPGFTAMGEVFAKQKSLTAIEVY